MLTGKYVISPIDGKQYCRKNGQFLEHLKTSGFSSYTVFFEATFPDQVQYCACGTKCVFNERKMTYKQTCGAKDCASKITSQKRQARTDEEWNSWKEKYQLSMSNKTAEEKAAFIETRVKTGRERGSYKNSVVTREQTCERRYGDKKYNNATQISTSKLAWDESRKQLFLERLKISLGGKSLNDFHTEEMFAARRKMLEERGDIIPQKQLTEWQRYSKRVRTLTNRTYRQYKEIINPNNLYRGMGGYELDHIVPVVYGFMNGIPETLMASMENLQLIPWIDNRHKGKKYDPTICSKHKELEDTDR